MALKSCLHFIPKGFLLRIGLRNLTSKSVVAQAQLCRKLSPQILTSSAPVRLLMTQENFQPLDEKFFKQDPTVALESLSPDMQKKLKVIKLEYEVLLQMGNLKLPSKMTDADWLKMLQFQSAHARKRFYSYLFKIEINKKAKEERKLKLQEQQKEKETSTRISRGNKSEILLFIRPKTMNHFYYSRLAHSMIFGQPLILDMDFENVMRSQDVMRLFEQFMMAYGSNKIHPDPFHVVLCNYNEKVSHFQKIFDNVKSVRTTEDYLFTLTPKSYLDLYPHKDLIYLTPDAPCELTTFDPNAIYIIGGIVDKMNTKPLTLAKAKKENLKMAKLPLDRYLRWSVGNKSLTLNQVFNILLELKLGKGWSEALLHVPRRKISEEKSTIYFRQ